jgi:hypothetical protein
MSRPDRDTGLETVLAGNSPGSEGQGVAIPTNRRKKRANRRKPKLHQATVAVKPSTTATKPQGATKPTTKNRTVLSPERLETIGKILPGIIKAVAVLIDAISKLLK